MFVKNENAKSFSLSEDIKSLILSNNKKFMMIENNFENGAIAKEHSHSHEQLGYVISGSFEFSIGDEIQILKAGDTFYVEPNIPHGCKALEKGKIIDVFSPCREDFLEKIK